MGDIPGFTPPPKIAEIMEEEARASRRFGVAVALIFTAIGAIALFGTWVITSLH